MDLVAGDGREILLALSVDDIEGFEDPDRFDAHLPLGAGLDPDWIDRFSEAVRMVCGGDQPSDFIDARRELDGPSDVGERTVERVDPAWITAIARVTDRELDAVTGRWIDLLEEELGAFPPEEKPWIRELAGALVQFCRRADRSADVLFAWSI